MDFSDAFSKSVEGTIRGLVGDRVLEIFLSCLERHGIRRSEILDSLGKFEAVLGEWLGMAGPVVEKQIAKRLYRDIGLELPATPHLALSDYVEIAQRRVTKSTATN